MEKLIESFPTEKVVGKNPDGTLIHSSFCLRHSFSNKMWIAGYGRNQKLDNPFTGSGYTVVEALDVLKSKLDAAPRN